MKIVKSEWRSIERRHTIEVNEDLINTIYENATIEEIEEILRQLRNNELNPAVIIEDAALANIELNWVYQNEDDWWANENITYEVIKITE